MRRIAVFLLIVPILAACGPAVPALVPGAGKAVGAASAATTARSRAAVRDLQSHGIASWYGPNFAGRRTANGEIFDPSQLTAAHRTLPFGTHVRVTNLENGRSVVVRINDRGPFKAGRIIDLSQAAANEVGMIGSGTAQVHVEIIGGLGGTYRVAVDRQLGAYDVAALGHVPGELLLLSSPNAGPVMVRVVDDEVANAELLLSRELYEELGDVVTVTASSLEQGSTASAP